MSESNPPRDGSKAAERLRAAAASVDKPAPSAGAEKRAAEKRIVEKPSPATKPAPAERERIRGAVADKAASERAATAARQARLATADARKAVEPAAAQRPSNAGADARVAAAKLPGGASAPASVRASGPTARGSGRIVPGAGEPYPPLTERMVSGIDAALADTRKSKRIAPRSPRTALEPDPVEMPARRSKSVRHPFVIVGNAIISFFVLAAIAAVVGLVLGKQQFDVPGPLVADRIVNIAHGSGIREIADVLTREGVIDRPWLFVGGVLVLKARQGLKAGEYEFKAHASLRDVIDTIVEGRVVMHQFAVPEGLTSEQIVARLMHNDVLVENIKEIPPEGSLLPDTYDFTRGTPREQIIRRMQRAQQRLIKEIWTHRAPDLPLKTPEQLVILASLVEKETGRPDERSRVAAVFLNRLKQKMRLQSDPTIIYGLVGGKGTLGRPLLKTDIDQPTPYNTYQIDGLPPGPITNPGRASLEAAANPARTRELYFVADGTGGHVFSETYEQHEKNVARLRRLENGGKDHASVGAEPVSSPVPAAPTAADPSPRHRHHHHRR